MFCATTTGTTSMLPRLPACGGGRRAGKLLASTLSPATDNADNRAPGNVVSNDTGADLARMDGRDGSKKGAEMPPIIVALAQARERGN